MAAQPATAQEWATLVLNDLGAPVSPNNLQFMAQWMASENNPATWTGSAGHDNPLNNGYGSGGGDGTGGYPDLVTAAQDVAANLKSGNYGYPAVVAALMASSSPTVTAQAIVASDWAGSHYNNGKNWAGGAVQFGGAAPAGGTTSPSSGGGTATAAAAANPIVATENIPGYGNVGVTAQQESAYDTITATFAAYGFDPTQVKQLSQWAWGEITSNTDPTQIALDLQTPGTEGYKVFEQVYPGFVNANAELAKQGLPAVSVANYAQYQQSAEALVRAAGLPTNMVDKQMIGKLVGGNVSITELNARINDAVTLAYQATPEQQTLFNNYFGSNYKFAGMGPHDVKLTPGQIAALTLNPQRAEPLIHQQITAAQIGGSGVTSGVGAISEGLAMRLAQNGITPAQAVSGFQQIGPLAGLEQGLPGQGAQGKQETVGPNTLAESQFLGQYGATRAIQVAQEVRKAPFTGGGGFTQTSKGVGVGSANSLGPTYTNS